MKATYNVASDELSIEMTRQTWWTWGANLRMQFMVANLPNINMNSNWSFTGKGFTSKYVSADKDYLEMTTRCEQHYCQVKF